MADLSRFSAHIAANNRAEEIRTKPPAPRPTSAPTTKPPTAPPKKPTAPVVYEVQPEQNHLSGKASASSSKSSSNSTSKGGNDSRAVKLEAEPMYLDANTTISDVGNLDAIIKSKIDARSKGVPEAVTGLRVVGLDMQLEEQLLEMAKSMELVEIRRFCTRTKPVRENSQWMTYGVVGSRSEPKTTSTGAKYLIVQLYDMSNVIMSMMVFGDAMRPLLSKLTVGALVLVGCAQLRPETRPNDKHNPTVSLHRRAEFSLSVNNEDQVLVLGKAADFGSCPAFKSTGSRGGQMERCGAFINFKHTTYCAFHLKQQYNKALSERTMLNNNATHIAAPVFTTKIHDTGLFSEKRKEKEKLRQQAELQSRQASKTNATPASTQRPLPPVPAPQRPVSSIDPFAAIGGAGTTITQRPSTTSAAALASAPTQTNVNRSPDGVARQSTKANVNPFASVPSSSSSSSSTSASSSSSSSSANVNTHTAKNTPQHPNSTATIGRSNGKPFFNDSTASAPIGRVTETMTTRIFAGIKENFGKSNLDSSNPRNNASLAQNPLPSPPPRQPITTPVNNTSNTGSTQRQDYTNDTLHTLTRDTRAGDGDPSSGVRGCSDWATDSNNGGEGVSGAGDADDMDDVLESFFNDDETALEQHQISHHSSDENKQVDGDEDENETRERQSYSGNGDDDVNGDDDLFSLVDDYDEHASEADYDRYRGKDVEAKEEEEELDMDMLTAGLDIAQAAAADDEMLLHVGRASHASALATAQATLVKVLAEVGKPASIAVQAHRRTVLLAAAARCGLRGGEEWSDAQLKQRIEEHMARAKSRANAAAEEDVAKKEEEDTTGGSTSSNVQKAKAAEQATKAEYISASSSSSSSTTATAATVPDKAAIERTKAQERAHRVNTTILGIGPVGPAVYVPRSSRLEPGKDGALGSNSGIGAIKSENTPTHTTTSSPPLAAPGAPSLTSPPSSKASLYCRQPRPTALAPPLPNTGAHAHNTSTQVPASTSSATDIKAEKSSSASTSTESYASLLETSMPVRTVSTATSTVVPSLLRAVGNGAGKASSSVAARATSAGVAHTSASSTSQSSSSSSSFSSSSSSPPHQSSASPATATPAPRASSSGLYGRKSMPQGVSPAPTDTLSRHGSGGIDASGNSSVSSYVDPIDSYNNSTAAKSYLYGSGSVYTGMGVSHAAEGERTAQDAQKEKLKQRLREQLAQQAQAGSTVSAPPIRSPAPLPSSSSYPPSFTSTSASSSSIPPNTSQSKAKLPVPVPPRRARSIYDEGYSETTAYTAPVTSYGSYGAGHSEDQEESEGVVVKKRRVEQTLSSAPSTGSSASSSSLSSSSSSSSYSKKAQLKPPAQAPVVDAAALELAKAMGLSAGDVLASSSQKIVSRQQQLLDRHAYDDLQRRIEQENRIEKMELALDSIKERQVVVYKCIESDCGVARKWREGKNEYCSKRNHQYKTKKVIKRWFRCQQCKDTTATFDRTVPTVNCKCNVNGVCAPRWEQISEFARSRPLASTGLGSDGDKLVLRYDDQLGAVPKYVNDNEMEETRGF